MFSHFTLALKFVDLTVLIVRIVNCFILIIYADTYGFDCGNKF